MSASPSTLPDAETATRGGAGDDWPALPTETDIYLLPDGRVVIADLPVELTALARALGRAEPCAIAPDETAHGPVDDGAATASFQPERA